MDALGVIVGILLMGYSWTGTQIRIYDDGDATGGHSAGNPHTAAEMAASSDVNVAANWLAYTSNKPAYRGLATVLVGSSTGGTNNTTWTDSNAIFSWDSGKTMSMPGTGGTNVFINWGNKVGSGSIATGRNGVAAYFGTTTTLLGRLMLYGCSFESTGALNMRGDSSSEYIDLICGSTQTGATGTIGFGTSSSQTGTLYNVDLWGNVSGATNGLVNSMNPLLCQRLTIGGNSFGSEFKLAGQLNLSLKDVILFGTPSTSDFILTGAAPQSWDLVRPIWSGATRFLFSGGTITPGNVRERWLFDTRVVDLNGDPVAGVLIKLTDALGNVQVNDVTDSSGSVNFGSGITQNAVIVRDHYTTAGVYAVRDRSPFLMEVNGGQQRYRFSWPTDATGAFMDFGDAIPLQYAAGGPTTWNERVAP